MIELIQQFQAYESEFVRADARGFPGSLLGVRGCICQRIDRGIEQVLRASLREIRHAPRIAIEYEFGDDLVFRVTMVPWM